jgi:hypothetical protein
MQQSLYFLVLTLSIVFSPPPGAGTYTPYRAQCEMSDKGLGLAARVGDGLAQEKRTRTPAQKKIDSQLLYAIYRKRGEAKAKGVPSGELRVQFDEEGRAIVSIRARVTRRVLAKIKSVGGIIISQSERYNDIRARVPLERLEALAALKDVIAIMPAEEATTNSATQ